MTAVASAIVLGCFPDPPRPAEDVEVQEDITTEDTHTSSDTSEDALADGTTHDADASDTSTEVDLSLDTLDETDSVTPLDTADVHETSTDVDETRDDADATFDTTDDEAGDAHEDVTQETSNGDVEPECSGAEACAHLTAACVEGQCLDGRCVAIPLSAVPCDDGDACSSGDECDTGVCRGQTVSCEPLDTCHDAGVCDPSTGLCSNPLKPDLSPCDDGLRCTDDDRCSEGRCQGTVRTCQASDQCHEPGTCDPLTGLCTNPAKPNFTPCDDGDFCTIDDFCSVQRCQAGHPPDDTTDDWILVLEGDGDIEVHAIAEEPDGSIVAVGLVEATTVTIRNGQQELRTDPIAPESRCAIFRLDIAADGNTANLSTLGGAPTCEGDDAVSAGLGLSRLADGTFIIGGAYFGGTFELNGRSLALGESPSGLSLAYGMWIGRLEPDGSFRWVTDFIGAGVQSRSAGYRGLAASALGSAWLATSASAGGALEIVYGPGDAETILNTESGVGTGYLFALSSSGRRMTTWRITCVGTCIVMPTVLARSDDGMLFVGGVANGGAVTAQGTSPAGDVTVATGLTTGFEGWVVAYGPSGPAWGRHFFSDFNGVQVGAAFVHAVANERGLTAVGAFAGQARTRMGSALDTLLASGDAIDPPDPTSTSNAYWFLLSADGNIVDAAHLHPEAATAGAVTSDGERIAVAGKRDEVHPPANEPVETLFVAQVSAWDRVMAIPTGDPARFLARLDGASPVSIAYSARGLVAAINIEAQGMVGLDPQLAVTPPESRTHAAIMRVNSARGLECQ